MAKDLKLVFEEAYQSDNFDAALELAEYLLDKGFDGKYNCGKLACILDLEIKSASKFSFDYKPGNAGYVVVIMLYLIDYFNDCYINDYIYWAARATSDEHVERLIYSLLPQIIDYAIKNQVRLFNGPGDFTEVFDKLDDATREKVIWNMELFG